MTNASRRILSLCVLAGALGCAANGNEAVDDIAIGPPPPPAPPAFAEGPAIAPPPPLAEIDEPLLVHHLNLTLIVDDPTAALDQARRIVIDAGGDITHASGQPENANLNATVPSGAHLDVRKALAQLDGTVQNENTSSNDMAREVERLRKRLRLLAIAETQLTSIMQHRPDPDTLDAVMLQRELNHRERDNLQNQIQSYRDQVRRSHVYVSFTRRK